MSKTTLVLFWLLWLLDVLAALFGYREFISGVFGRYASASSKYVTFWIVLLIAILLILRGSLYFKNHEQSVAAMIIVAIPSAVALPYGLFWSVILLSGNKNWR